MRSMNFRRVAATLGAALLMAGCASSSGPQYYSLAETAAPVRTPVAAVGATPVYIELAPIAMPERFARPQMVVRKKGSRTQLLRFTAQSKRGQTEASFLEMIGKRELM